MPAFHPAWLDPIASISGFRDGLWRGIWIVGGIHALRLPVCGVKDGAIRISKHTGNLQAFLLRPQ